MTGRAYGAKLPLQLEALQVISHLLPEKTFTVGPDVPLGRDAIWAPMRVAIEPLFISIILYIQSNECLLVGYSRGACQLMACSVA